MATKKKTPAPNPFDKVVLRPPTKTTGTIDAGAGSITYNVGGSLDCVELMEALDESIKNIGVRATISKLA